MIKHNIYFGGVAKHDNLNLLFPYAHSLQAIQLEMGFLLDTAIEYQAESVCKDSRWCYTLPPGQRQSQVNISFLFTDELSQCVVSIINFSSLPEKPIVHGVLFLASLLSELS